MGGLAGGGISLGTLSVAITATVDEALRSLQKFGDDVGEEIGKQKKKWDSLGEVGQNMTTLGATLTGALTVPIAGIGAAAISAASDFESSLNKITAVSGTTGAELESLRALAMKLGADTKFSAQEAAEGMGNLAASGFNTNQIMAAMPGILDLAAAGQLSVDQASEIAAASLAQFGLDASEAGRVADLLAQGAAASAISVADMGKTMVYVGPVAKSAGISIDELATATALLGNAGIKADQAGTSLRGIIGSLVSPSTKAQEALDALGITTTDAAGKMLPLDNIFKQLQASGATTADMFEIFDNASAAAASTLQNTAGPAWAAMTQQMDASEGAATRMATTLNTGLKGAWEQMKGSLDTVLIALGTSLLPLMTKLIEVGTKFVNDWILPAVQAFGQLDPALQAAIIAFAAMVAAIGPILLIVGQMAIAIAAIGPALTAMGITLTVSVGALLGWAVAIAAAVAALIALGVWVYNNWDAIVAVVAQAWEGIQELWSAAWQGIIGFITGLWDGIKETTRMIWEPIVAYLSAIWGPVIEVYRIVWGAIAALLAEVWGGIKTAAETVWNGLTGWLTGLWEGIKQTAVTVWGGITDAISKFLEWAAKIPGVAKLMNLDEAWKSAQKAGEEFDKTAAATEKTGKAADAAAPKVGALATATGTVGDKSKTAKSEIEKMKDEIIEGQRKADLKKQAMRELGLEVEETGKKHKGAKDEVKKFNDEILLEKLKQAQQEHNKLVKEIAAYEIAMEKAGGKAFDLNAAMEKLTANTNLGAMAVSGITAKLPPMNTDMQDAITRTQNLDGAFKTLGITSSTEFAKIAANAQIALDAVIASDEATDIDVKTAIYKALQAQIAASKAAGIEIPKDQAKLLEDLKTELETKVPEMKKPFEGLATSVSTVITNFAQDISKSLWDGDMSWGEKGKTLLKSLGQAVTSAFIEPATAAIGTFIKGALTDLLGSGGFGGIWDSIKGLGGAIGGIFGGGGAKPPVPTLPTGPGGGAGGGLGGIMGGAGGWVSGIGSAISGALSFIGTMRTEGTLNAIEKEVRYSQIHLFYILSDLNDFFHRDWWVLYGLVLDIKSAIVDSMEPQLARAAQKIDVLKQIAENDLKVSLGAIANDTVDIRASVDYAAVLLDQILLESSASNARLDKMIATSERIAAASERSVNMNLYGTDPEIVAARIAQQLRLQGGNG